MKTHIKRWPLAILLMATCACQMQPNKTTTLVQTEAHERVPSNNDENSMYSQNLADRSDEERHQITFTQLMNESSDANRIERFKKFIKRQFEIYTISEELLIQFDEKLDILHQKTLSQQPLTESDVVAFNEARFKMKIAWAFHENNQNEILDLYQMLLAQTESADKPFYNASIKLISDFRDWLKAQRKESNLVELAALHSLALEMEDINNEYRQAHRALLYPHLINFKPILNLPSKTLVQARQAVMNKAQSRQREYIDYFIQQRWTEHLENIQKEELDQYSAYDLKMQDFVGNREPNTDAPATVFKPDPGAPGHVSGSNFPKGTWVMSYDDGPHPVHTPNILKNLGSTETKATFFWLTQNIAKYPTIVKQIGDAGHSRASHSYTHANLPTLGSAALNHEINDALDGFKKTVGQPATFFRCPYGACGKPNSAIRQMIAKRNALEVIWNVDSEDWQDKNPDTVFTRTKKQIDTLGRGIILFHDIHPQSVIASDKTIRYIKSLKGTQISLLKEVVTKLNGGTKYESP